MRGIAAMWVVLHHAHLSVGAFLIPIVGVPLVANGSLGVDFFFVLSGFIIAYSSARMIEEGRGILSYLQSRILRIYVPYLPVGVGILFLYWLLPDLSASDRTPSVLTSLTLLPTNDPPALSVAWTLVHEVIFYAVFATVFLSKRLHYALLGLWALAILGCTYLDAPLSRAGSYLLSPMNLCFHLGVGVFHLSRWRLPKFVSPLSAATGTAAVAFAASSTEPNLILAASGFSLLVFSAASKEWANVKIWKFATVLGAASYSIYLVHNPTVSAMTRVVKHVDPSANPWITLVVVSVTSIVAGLIYWSRYERVALKLLRGWLHGLYGGNSSGLSLIR